MTTSNAHLPRMGMVLREGERVSPLELFFDLVFVLAITQCTALMSHDPMRDTRCRPLDPGRRQFQAIAGK